jgi:hypothetical protein
VSKKIAKDVDNGQRLSRSSQPANRQLANQISIKMEFKAKNLHFYANLVCPKEHKRL